MKGLLVIPKLFTLYRMNAAHKKVISLYKVQTLEQ